MTDTSTGIAYDRAGPRGAATVVLIHAGVADRRMWEPLWSPLIAGHDVLRLDLRGFGDSVLQPAGPLSPVDDVLHTLDELGIADCHLVGASFGAGVAVEVALTRPDQVRSLLLSAPGGSLIAELTPDLAEFVEAENAALGDGDLPAAVEANLAWWVDGPHRTRHEVDHEMRALVGAMQRRAFDIDAVWGGIEHRELEPPALNRLAEITAPTLILLGVMDLQAIHDTAHRLADGITHARLEIWPDVAHLPSLERPAHFLALTTHWLDSVD